ncbi:MAG: hypothetical protein LBH05_04465 [Deferribacteraceae bacterium]|jgi:hypothetical protein|nr:hypothetical protein [Deferribacteraceae bacterium]
MDKSEGTDFISKTFSSLTNRVAKLYHAGHKKVSLTSMKNAHQEKLVVLGNKVFQMLKDGKPVTKELLKTEYDSITRMNADIAKAEKELKVMTEDALGGSGGVSESVKKAPVAKKTSVTKKVPAIKSASASGTKNNVKSKVKKDEKTSGTNTRAKKTMTRNVRIKKTE